MVGHIKEGKTRKEEHRESVYGFLDI